MEITKKNTKIAILIKTQEDYDKALEYYKRKYNAQDTFNNHEGFIAGVNSYYLCFQPKLYKKLYYEGSYDKDIIISEGFEVLDANDLPSFNKKNSSKSSEQSDNIGFCIKLTNINNSTDLLKLFEDKECGNSSGYLFNSINNYYFINKNNALDLEFTKERLPSYVTKIHIDTDILSNQEPKTPKHKFKEGEIVKIIKGGFGISSNHIGQYVRILKQSSFKYSVIRVDLGYIIESKDVFGDEISSNSSYFNRGEKDQIVGESSFVKLDPKELSSILEKLDYLKTYSESSHCLIKPQHEDNYAFEEKLSDNLPKSSEKEIISRTICGNLPTIKKRKKSNKIKLIN